MMRKLGIAALAGLGIALLFGTDQGRRLMSQAREMLPKLPEPSLGEPEAAAPKQLVQEVLEAPHPETAMAHAFQQAVAA
jgi:hypothetical protein